MISTLSIISLIIVTWIIVLGDITITFSNSKRKTQIKYNGLLWVALDSWTIWLYKSNDKPIKILKITNYANEF